METIDRIWHDLAALAAALWLALAALVGSLIAIGSWTHFFDDAEPPKITLATGPRELAFWEFGDKYRKALAGQVDVKVEPSNGSPDNKTSLQTGKADAALILGFTFNASDAKDLESLGALFDDGLWLLHRREGGNGQPSSPLSPKQFIDGLRSKKIAIGPDGGGTQELARSLLTLPAYGFTTQDITRRDGNLLRITTGDAVAQLKAGTIDAAFFATWFFADAVQKLVQDPDIELWDYPYARHLNNIPPLHTHTLTVSEGFIAPGKPPSDITVAATKASLVVRTDLPLTIQYQLLKAIGPIHANPSFQLGEAKFPSPDTLAVPLSVVAQEYYDGQKNPTTFYMSSVVADLHLRLWIKELIIRTLHNTVAQLAIGVLPLPLLLQLVNSLINRRRYRPVAKLWDRVGRLGEEIEKLERRRAPITEKRADEIRGDLDELEDQTSILLRRFGRHPHIHQLAVLLLERIQQRIKELRIKLQQHIDSMAASKPEGPPCPQSTGP